MSKSKFGAILNAAKSRQVDSPDLDPIEVTPTEPVQPVPQAIAPEPEPVKQKGRPRGKRSNPDYEQVTAYIKRETYRKTKIALLQRGDQREFSELVEDLLSEWLNS